MSIYTNLDKAKYGDWSFPKALPPEGDPKREEILSRCGGNTEKFPHLAEKYEGLEREHYFAFIYEALTEANKQADKEEDPEKLKMLRERVRLIDRKVNETRLDKYRYLDPEKYGNWTMYPLVPPGEENPERKEIIRRKGGDTKKYPYMAEEFEGLRPCMYTYLLDTLRHEVERENRYEEDYDKKKVLETRLRIIQSRENDIDLDNYNHPDPEVCGDWTFPSVLPPFGTQEREEFLKEYARDVEQYPVLGEFEGIIPSKYYELIKIKLLEMARTPRSSNHKKQMMLNERWSLVFGKVERAKRFSSNIYERAPTGYYLYFSEFFKRFNYESRKLADKPDTFSQSPIGQVLNGIAVSYLAKDDPTWLITHGQMKDT